MDKVFATYRNKQVIFDSPVDWLDGTRIELRALPPAPSQPSGEELERLLDELADIGESTIDPHTPPLSDYAVSREGIYREHP